MREIIIRSNQIYTRYSHNDKWINKCIYTHIVLKWELGECYYMRNENPMHIITLDGSIIRGQNVK